MKVIADVAVNLMFLSDYFIHLNKNSLLVDGISKHL